MNFDGECTVFHNQMNSLPNRMKFRFEVLIKVTGFTTFTTVGTVSHAYLQPHHTPGFVPADVAHPQQRDLACRLNFKRQTDIDEYDVTHLKVHELQKN